MVEKYFYKNLLPEDENGRVVNIYRISNVKSVGENLFYPNVVFKNEKDEIFYPIQEKIMSLQKLKNQKKFFETAEETAKETANLIDVPLFFFIYNTDNYYHFVYDSLPYLISFQILKKEFPSLRLLINYPNPQKKEIYKFVYEFLEVLGINHNDLFFIEKNTIYKDIYISDSFTHGIDSELKPRKEIYDFYKKISNKIELNNEISPKKIYISRRSWIHQDYSNIGTNYTSRRKLTNENEIVEKLKSLGYIEIFTEKMTIVEKINLFKNAEEIVGPIGGGLCNALFCEKKPKLFVICSPDFLRINGRFLFSFKNCNTFLFEDSEHSEKTDYKLYMRVKCGDIVGEITSIDNGKLEVQYIDASISGWNNSMSFHKKTLNICDCEKLDNGLNSSWSIDIDKFLNFIEQS